MSRLFSIIGVVIALFGVAPALAAEAGVERYAIVIGNNRSDQGRLRDLRYADDDAAAIHELLVEAGVTSALFTTLDAESRRLRPGSLPNGPARRHEIERKFAAFAAAMREKNAQNIPTEFLLFYSGHGDVDRGEGYVVLDDQRFSRKMLYSLLSRSPATKNHVFVDACRSFFLLFGKGPGGQRTPYGGTAPLDLGPGSLKNTGFVLSTSSDRESHEWERYQAGILSYELRSGLRGGADSNLDGRVSYAELGAFLKAANGSIANARFRPEFTIRPPAQDFKEEILSWDPAKPAIRLGAARLGHVYIETASGQRLLDVHPAPGQVLALHLPERERPLFVRNYDETAEYVVMDRRATEITSLEKTPEIASKGALHMALEQLFATPFGRRDVELYEQATRVEHWAPYDKGPEPSQTRNVIGTTAAVVALGVGAVGATLSGISAITYLGGEGKAQDDIARRNERVKDLNLASVVCYAVAGAAGITWGLTKVWPVSVETTQNGGVINGLTLDVSGRF